MQFTSVANRYDVEIRGRSIDDPEQQQAAATYRYELEAEIAVCEHLTQRLKGSF